jgi:hypothetical protein
MEWPFCFVHACGVHKGGLNRCRRPPDQSLVAEIFTLRSWTNLVERTVPDELEDLGELTENVVPVVRVLDGEFPFVENVIEIEKDLGWAIALAEEDLHRCPVSGKTGEKATIGCVTLVRAENCSGKWKFGYAFDLGRNSLRLKCSFEILEKHGRI